MSARQTLIILGGDIAGSMAAAYLGRHLPASRFEVILVDPSILEHSSWCAASHPNLKAFNRALGINEVDFITSANASFRLGDYYDGWGPAPYHNVFSDYGIAIGGTAFHDHLRHQAGEDALAQYEHYALPVRMAQAGVFTPPSTQNHPIISDYDYGYHLDPTAYAGRLTQAAISFDVKHIQSTPKAYTWSENKLDTVMLSNGTELCADLYINASGHPLAETAFNAWTEIGCAQSYTAYAHEPQSKRLGLSSHFKTTQTGWTLSCPNQLGDIELAFFDNPETGEHRYEAGYTQQVWQANVLNIGFSSAIIEPFLGLTLRTIQHDLERLLALFPARLGLPDTLNEQVEYNRLSNAQHEYLRDYIAIHYASSTKSIDGNLLPNLSASLPPSARAKLDMFKARGRINMLDERDSLRGNWVPMLLGHGIRPERYNLMAEDVDVKEFKEATLSLESLIIHTIEHMPRHEDFIKRRCAAKGFNYGG